MYDGDRLSKKETSILPKTCQFIDTGDLDSFSGHPSTEFSSMLAKTILDDPKFANIPGSIKCR